MPEVSAGIVNGFTWNQMAIMIARTEAHRIQQKTALDC